MPTAPRQGIGCSRRSLEGRTYKRRAPDGAMADNRGRRDKRKHVENHRLKDPTLPPVLKEMNVSRLQLTVKQSEHRNYSRNKC